MERQGGIPVIDGLRYSFGQISRHISDSAELYRREGSVDWARRFSQSIWSEFGGSDGRTVSLNRVRWLLQNEEVVVRAERALRDFQHGSWESNEEHLLNRALNLDTPDGKQAAADWFTQKQKIFETWIKFERETGKDYTKFRRRSRACRTTILLLQQAS